MTKIVVIEDEFDIRDEIMNWLRYEGHEVVGAKNGKLGLDAIRSVHPDLVLCDIMMPEMDGHEVLIELRADVNFAQLPFVFLTSAADRQSVREGMNLGADDYLTKPFRHQEVINMVQARLGKQDQIQTQIAHLNDIIDAEREQYLLKSRLVGMFSHDFRNPLAAILMSSNMLQSYTDRMSPERKQQHFQRIDGSVHKLLQMLDEMLMTSELESGQLTLNLQPTNLRMMLESLLEEFKQISGGKHHLVLSSALPELVDIDPKLAQHVITNLISNAIKYSPEGTQIRVVAQIEDGEIVIAVADAGIGIPEEDLPHIFEPFFRANNAHNIKGSGLGLALVKQILDICGGRIDVVSQHGSGSCFTVYCPIKLG